MLNISFAILKFPVKFLSTTLYFPIRALLTPPPGHGSITWKSIGKLYNVILQIMRLGHAFLLRPIITSIVFERLPVMSNTSNEPAIRDTDRSMFGEPTTSSYGCTRSSRCTFRRSLYTCSSQRPSAVHAILHFLKETDFMI